MKLIRKGFDGLDVSFPLTVNEAVAAKLLEAQEQSKLAQQDVGIFTHNGLTMLVAQTGASGGYAYRCSTEPGTPFGENWFLKHPRDNGDEWGVWVSCGALSLALHGLQKVRADLEQKLERLELNYELGSESIGRVDFAFDFLAPDLRPQRDHFVTHSRTKVREHADLSIDVDGKSGRVETITVGKNPGRQVILYDKRAEIIAKKKPYWLNIWNDARQQDGHAPLVIEDRAQSEVWRVEVRAFKEHLKGRWGVTTWGNLKARLPQIIETAFDQVRFTLPTSDTNRSRWPDHPIWVAARAALDGEFDELASMADPDEIREICKAVADETLLAQVSGCMIARAGLHGVSADQLQTFIAGTADHIGREIGRHPDRATQKLEAARARYGVCDNY